MPQYDAYEDPIPILPPSNPVAEHTPSLSSLDNVPVNKPLTTCYGEGVNKPSDTDTPEMNEMSPPSSPYKFHRRHSHLSRQQSPMEDPIESFIFPKPLTSPKPLSAAERAQFVKLECSQRQDDDIMATLESDQQHAKKTADKHDDEESVDMDGEIEFKKEKHMLRGGWAHRSRGSCELLQDHKSWNVGGD